MSKSIDPRTVADVSSQTESDPITIYDLEEASYWVVGTFAGTGQIQISPDSVAWIDFGSTFTVPTKTVLPTDARFARLSVTAYTSGDFESQVTGRDEESQG